MDRRAAVASLLSLIVASAETSDIAAAAETGGVVAPWPPARSASPQVQDLHREYHNIVRVGNRNAASHLWASFLLERAPQMTWERLQFFFTGFCAVSGSPVRPSDYTRYQLTLPSVTGGEIRGFMYYCCWPCVCDTNDFIRVDTMNITTAEGTRRTHVAVIGDPCKRPEALREPFTQPFYGRGVTTLEREAAEVRCHEGKLAGATWSDHGHPVIQLFPLSGDGAVPPLAAAEPPTPGRMRSEPGTSLNFQDEFEYSAMCAQREANGFNSGMGEIFRRVAMISPVPEAECSAADVSRVC
jgi:hypothetical protein